MTKKILIVDDFIFILELMQTALTRKYPDSTVEILEVTDKVLAQNANVVVDTIKSNAYAAVLMDGLMPGTKGWDIIREIRRLEQLQQTVQPLTRFFPHSSSFPIIDIPINPKDEGTQNWQKLIDDKLIDQLDGLPKNHDAPGWARISAHLAAWKPPIQKKVEKDRCRCSQYIPTFSSLFSNCRRFIPQVILDKVASTIGYSHRQ